MVDQYVLDEISEELVKKYKLDNPGSLLGWGSTEYPRKKLTKTPFTNYDIVEIEGKYYVKIPKDGA